MQVLLRQMKFLILTVFLSHLGLALNNRTAIIIDSNFPTALVGDKRAIPFKPTENQIKLIEKNLAALLKSKHPKIFKKLASYYRQYTGLEIVNDKKIIRGNFLCEIDKDRWLKEWIITFDGGDCYFNFTFELEKSEITDLSINGES